jgi:hypothetical protein
VGELRVDPVMQRALLNKSLDWLERSTRKVAGEVGSDRC